MNILLVDAYPQLVRAFRDLGHTVHDLYGVDELFSLSGYLAESGFQPDLLFQQEHLVRRSFIRGLDSAPFPTLFWPLDSHVNLFWQQWYSLLFDAVLTPHMSLFSLLPDACRPPSLHRFAWYGEPRPLRPFAERRYALGFCGRSNPVHRPVRAWMLELLDKQGLRAEDSLTQEDMFRFFDDVRCVPNESISYETNFRLLEAGACGCLVLSPDIGDDQNALFEPGKELLVYHDAPELLEQTAWAEKHPDAAEKIGRAAWERIRAEHTPLHRAQTALNIAAGLSRNRRSGLSARLCFWLGLARRMRNLGDGKGYSAHADKGLDLLRGAPAWGAAAPFTRDLVAHCFAQALCLYGEDREDPAAREKGLRLSRELAAGRAVPESATPPDGPGDPHRAGAPIQTVEVALAASFFALKAGDFQQARFFYLLFTDGRAPRLPETPYELCLAWAETQSYESTMLQRGFLFSPDEGFLPSCALDCLLYARFIEPDNQSAQWFHLFNALTARHASFNPLRLGSLAQHSMLEPDNWRIRQDYGLLCLRTCRMEQGLFELREALADAATQGRERLFMRRLKAAGPDNRNWAALLPARPPA